MIKKKKTLKIILNQIPRQKILFKIPLNILLIQIQQHLVLIHVLKTFLHYVLIIKIIIMINQLN